MKPLNRSIGKLVFIVICFSMLIAIGRSQENSDQSRAPQGARTANVVDAIQMTQLVVENRGDVSSSNPAQFSPDGHYFVVVTKRGDIEKNTNVYSLLLFPTNKQILSANPIVLVSMSSSSNDPGIQDVKWIDDRTLAFLGENPAELQQVYIVDRETKQLTKLTNHSTSVLSYEVNPRDRSVLFLAQPPLKPLFDEKSGKDWVVVSNEPLWDLIAGVASTGGPRMPRSQLYITKNDRELQIGTQGNLEARAGLLLSPDARYVVVKGMAADIPEIWKDYEDRQLQSAVNANPSYGAVRVVYQYELINLESGKSKPLLDAPVSDGNRADALWAADSSSLIVSSYLPLTVSDKAERKLRQTKKMIVEIKVPTAEIVPISSRELHLVEWDARGGGTLIARTSSGSDRTLLAFQKAADGWKEVELTYSANRQKRAVAVTLEEDMNTPPKLFVTDLQTGQKSVLLDLNPQFNGLSFGRVQSVVFNATDGHKVRAGLYLPPNYVQGQKYPLVIQTHAWNPKKFWIDGYSPSAFAAQPLAAKGFAVLQVEEDLSKLSTLGEAPGEASAYEGGIDYLAGLGIIDRNRVGVIAHSQTGLGVQYALTHSKYHFGAATLADPSDGGYFFYLSLIPALSTRYPMVEGINGGPPFDDGLINWLKNSPGFNLAKVNTPVREEAYHPYSLFFTWEWFAGLSRLGKPVELIYRPDANHNLVRPRDRLTSLEGNVDWFCFWLKDEEDPDPAKVDQYKRWHELRKLQEKSRATQHNP
jgi:dipeptidyl aminopeptidase/acylaminoacyl peptidase